jgi:Helix-turn-helix domain
MAVTLTAEERRQRWLWSSFKRRYFTKKHALRDEHDRWRKVAELQRLSRAARGRLEWVIFWEKNGRDVSLTARHFGIARKTFYTWSARFEKDFLRGLEDRSRTPHRTRSRTYTPRQYENVLFLRRQHLRYGKMKLRYGSALYPRPKSVHPHGHRPAYESRLRAHVSHPQLGLSPRFPPPPAYPAGREDRETYKRTTAANSTCISTTPAVRWGSNTTGPA